MSEDGPEERIDFGSLERLSANARPPKEPSSFVPKLLGTLAFLAVGAVVVAVPWYFLTRTQPAKPAATPSARATTASPSASPTVAAQAGSYEVTGVDNCANVRSAPGVSAPIIDCLTLGVRVTSDGKSEDLGGITWLHVVDPFKRGAEAWMAAQYLKKVG